jgi:hypothetical protein
MLPKLKAFWDVTVHDVSENSGAFILLSPEDGDTAVFRISPNAT